MIFMKSTIDVRSDFSCISPSLGIGSRKTRRPAGTAANPSSALNGAMELKFEETSLLVIARTVTFFCQH